MKKEIASINKKILKQEGQNYCPYCGSENVRFIGFIRINFLNRKNFFRCRDCKKKIE